MRYLWIVLLGLTGGLVWNALADGAPGSAVVLGLIGLGLAWLFSPWQGGRTDRHQDVLERPVTDRDVVIYWRPGCIFCIRLRGRLGRHGKEATWVNIWQDPAAAEFVRGVNGGNETVPTVVIGGEAHTNPDPQEVLDHILASR